MSYASSDSTKSKIVNAAGELAAERGLDSVSTRAVADASGENIGSIHYHFGGKDGLFEAVVREAMSGCVEKEVYGVIDALGEKPSKTDLAQTIRVAVAGEITDLFRSDRPAWHSQVIYQLLQRDDHLYEILREHLMDPSMDSMGRLFSLINPDLSVEDCFLHICLMKMPIFAHANYMKAMHKRLGVAQYSEDYLQKMENMIVRQTQLALGLPEV